VHGIAVADVSVEEGERQAGLDPIPAGANVGEKPKR